MNSKELRIFCTVGAGLESIAAEELSPFTCGSLKTFQGKLLFTTRSESLDSILKCKLVERVFLCLLHTQLDDFDGAQNLLSSVKHAIERIDWNQQGDLRNIWVFYIRERLPLSSSSVSPSIIPAQFFIKLRPKSLIRYTSMIRAAVSQTIQDGLGLQFSRNSAVEVNLILSNKSLFLGLPLSRQTLAHRSYIKHIGLRSTSAAALVRGVQNGVVLDPMCGKGSLLLELETSSPSQPKKVKTVTRQFLFLLGCDVNVDQLALCRENLECITAEESGDHVSWDLLRCRLECSPLRSGIFDHVVCDLPFGKKHGAYCDDVEVYDSKIIRHFYGKWLPRIADSLNTGGKCDILVPSQLSNYSIELLEKVNMKTNETRVISLGTTEAAIVRAEKIPREIDPVESLES